MPVYLEMMKNKFVCIHGHFYQPPRENAWLEEIELQESAHPYHDWNERITAECYGPNTAARILNQNGKIINIVNNYARINFNFGPTLLSWMEDNANDIYKAILNADQLSQRLFDGHGSAIAQAYNHMIMPLANRRDKETQVKWGIYDFETRFKRFPEGMWLPETAIDIETLEVLAEHRIKYTILAPRQAHKVAEIDSKEWKDVSQGKIDPRQPYLCELPSGKSIVLFFYDGSVSQDIAFSGLLRNGKDMANRLISQLNFSDDKAQLIHIATDGESYGHHHHHGEMALVYCLNFIEKNTLAQIINYGAFLARFPPEMKVQIFENSSWSCVHGVERWRDNCGCSSGMNRGWHQVWRGPLRDALDWLRDRTLPVYETVMREFTNDPFQVRNKFIEVIEDRSRENVERFLEENFEMKISGVEKTRILRILEMQRNNMLMYTSCGWFFDEVSGIETVQILQYANRSIQLAEREGGVLLNEEFKKILKNIPSNIPELGDALFVYENMVEPARLTLSKVGMHYAVASLFSPKPESLVILNYRAESEFFDRLEAGVQRLSVGRTVINSRITLSEKRYNFAVVYLGQHLIIGSLSYDMSEAEFHKMFKEIKDAFLQGIFANVISVMQKYFGHEKFSIKQLFKDEQRKVLNKILFQDLRQAENSYKKIHDRNYNIMNVMYSLDITLPKLFRENLQIVINTELRKYFQKRIKNTLKLKALVDEVKKWKITLDEEEIGLVAGDRLFKMISKIVKSTDPVGDIRTIRRVLAYLNELDFYIDFYKIQNEFFWISKNELPVWKEKSGSNKDYEIIVREFMEIGSLIQIEVEE